MKSKIIFIVAFMCMLISCNTTPKKTYPLGGNTKLVMIDAEGGGYLLYNPETNMRSEEPLDTVYVGKHALVGYQEYMDKKFIYTLDGRLLIENSKELFICETPSGKYFYLYYSGGDYDWYNTNGVYKGYYNERYAFRIIEQAKRDKNNPFLLYIEEKYYPGK